MLCLHTLRYPPPERYSSHPRTVCCGCVCGSAVVQRSSIGAPRVAGILQQKGLDGGSSLWLEATVSILEHYSLGTAVSCSDGEIPGSGMAGSKGTCVCNPAKWPLAASTYLDSHHQDLTRSFNKCLFSTSHLPGTVLGALMTDTKQSAAFLGLPFWGGDGFKPHTLQPAWPTILVCLDAGLSVLILGQPRANR